MPKEYRRPGGAVKGEIEERAGPEYQTTMKKKAAGLPDLLFKD